MKSNSKAMITGNSYESLEKEQASMTTLRLPKMATSNLFQTDKDLLSFQSIVR